MMSSESPPPPIACPVCSAATYQEFFLAEGLPTLSCALWPTEQAGRSCPRGDIALACCGTCGYIGNPRFDPALIEYDAEYENALHFSGTYREYWLKEAELLIERHALRGKTIIEVGCGDAQFLSLLCQLGDNTGVGYDPSFVPDEHAPPLDARVRVEQRYYSDQDAGTRPDLIISRQVLEHIPGPLEFMESLRARLPSGHPCVICFEVPNAGYLIRDLSVWDLIYEHCSFFTETGLRSLFRVSGFQTSGVRTGFGGQNLTIEAVPGEPIAPESGAFQAEAGDILDAVATFQSQAPRRIASANTALESWLEPQSKVAMWGAGARVTVFLSIVEFPHAIGHVVDINPRKHGSHLPGSGHEIHHPETLVEYQPDVVVLMNPNYRDEVARELDRMGLDAELVIP